MRSRIARVTTLWVLQLVALPLLAGCGPAQSTPFARVEPTASRNEDRAKDHAVIAQNSSAPMRDPQLRPPRDWQASRATGAICFNGSQVDCNVERTTLNRASAWVDPEPPSGFSQCAGFINTPGDDVAAEFMDGCIGAAALRVRVFTREGTLEEDIIAQGVTPFGAWPNFDYLGGDISAEKRTSWGDTTFFTTTDGRDACMRPAARTGMAFGSGNANVAIVVGANTGDDEYRISCGGSSLPGRRIAIYRGRGNELIRAR